MKKYRLLKLVSAVALLGAGALALAPKKAESVSAANRTLYCRCAQSWWKADDAAVGAYYWGGTNGTSWPGARMTPVDGETDLWSIDIPDDHTSVIFTRVNGSGDVAYWGAKTDDLTIPTDGKNCFTITQSTAAWDGALSAGEWGTYPSSAEKCNINKYEVLDGVAADSPFATEKVDKGSTYDVPANRFKSGYSFEGWYTNPGCTTPYASSTINAELSLYAKYKSGTWAGNIVVELGALGCSWNEAAANYAVYFFNKSYSPTAEGWSSYVTGTSAGRNFVEIPYNLDFNPSQMLVVRYSPEFTAQAWEANKWASDTESKWGQTEDLFYRANSLVRVGSYNDESKKNDAAFGYPKIIGGVGGSWNDLEFLDHYKTNGAGHPEFYDPCYLPKNTAFKIQFSPYNNGTYVNTFTTHESLKDVFSLDGDGNLVAGEEGNYVFYYDDVSLSFYITAQYLADADEWAQDFLTVNCEATKAQWSTMGARFNAMSKEARDLFVEAAHVAHDAEVSGYVALAVQRYDYVIELYGTSTYSDFMKREAAGKIVPGSLGAQKVTFGSADSNNLVIIVTVVSIVSISTLAALIVIKKRKAINK